MPTVIIQLHVGADRERRQRCLLLPGGAEPGRPEITAVEPQGIVGPLERAIAQPPEDHVLSVTQDREVDGAVRIDVERIGAGHVRHLGPGRLGLSEPERPPDGALVDVERRRVRAAGEVEVGLAVVIAVEHGDAAADEEGPITVVRVNDACRLGLFHEARSRQRLGWRRRAADVQHHEGPGHSADYEDHTHGNEPRAHAHRTISRGFGPIIRSLLRSTSGRGPTLRSQSALRCAGPRSRRPARECRRRGATRPPGRMRPGRWPTAG